MVHIKMYYTDGKYINYLRQFDDRVPYNKNSNRPYIGIVYAYQGINYFAPLSSPKPKHKTISDKAVDIFKIDDGNLGVVNLNNMIPIPNIALTDVLSVVSDQKYRALLENQLTYINNHKSILLKKVTQLQRRYRSGYLPQQIAERCCNFELLEEKCREYVEQHQSKRMSDRIKAAHLKADKINENRQRVQDKEKELIK